MMKITIMTRMTMTTNRMRGLKTMNKEEYHFYKLISQTRQTQLLEWTKDFLTDVFTEDRVVATKDFIYAIGDVPIMLVAHLDTVHKEIPWDIYYDRDKRIVWSPQGLGADDRAGVFSIMTILKNGFRPHILFTTDEEIGGLGARAAAKQLTPDVNFVIEVDRRGEKDSVFYDCDNPKFEEYINKFGFNTNYGSFSDISYLCPDWGMAGVNLSIGYDCEHTKAETLNVAYMFSTIGKIQRVIQQMDVAKDHFEYIPMAAYTEGAEYLSFMNNYDRIDFGYGKSSDYTGANEVCHECFKGFSPELIIDMDKEGQYCGDCYAKLFTTCIKCSKAFKDRSRRQLYCPDCSKTDNDSRKEV